MNALAPSEVCVDLAAYTHNLDVVRRFVGASAWIAAVIKADAYGHGLIPIAQKALTWGVDMLAVATVAEGVQLREAGVSDKILILGQPEHAALEAAVIHELCIMLSDRETAEYLGTVAARLQKVATVHCKIDTGMGRQGFSLEQAADDLQRLTRISHIDIEGIATHFPIAERADNPYTYDQIKAFKQALRQLDKKGVPYELAHAANSAAIVNYHGSVFDMVRPGLMTYGVWPVALPPIQNVLKPVMQWTSRVTHVREMPAGLSIGYGRTYTTPSRMRLAIIPVGYADGYKHQLGNCADVLIHGKRCPVRGSVCMDQIMVDVTQLDAIAPGDTVTLLGADGEETISAIELARHAETIPYDILTGIGARVARVYVDDAEQPEE